MEYMDAKYGLLLSGHTKGLKAYAFCNIPNSQDVIIGDDDEGVDVDNWIEDGGSYFSFTGASFDEEVFSYERIAGFSVYSIYKHIYDYRKRFGCYCVSIFISNEYKGPYKDISNILRGLARVYKENYIKSKKETPDLGYEQIKPEIKKADFSLFEKELNPFPLVKQDYLIKDECIDGREACYTTYKGEEELISLFSDLNPRYRPELRLIYIFSEDQKNVRIESFLKKEELPPIIKDKINLFIILEAFIPLYEENRDIQLLIKINNKEHKKKPNKRGEISFIGSEALSSFDLLEIELIDETSTFKKIEPIKNTIEYFRNKKDPRKAQVKILLEENETFPQVIDTVEFEIHTNKKKKPKDIKGLEFQIEGYGTKRVNKLGKIYINDVPLNEPLIVSLKNDNNYENYENEFVIRTHSTKKVFQIDLKAKEEEIVPPSSFYLSIIFPEGTKEEKLDRIIIYRNETKKLVLTFEQIKNYKHINIPRSSQDDTIKIDIESEKFRIIEDVEFVLGESHDGRGCIEIKLEAILSNNFLLFRKVFGTISANLKKIYVVGAIGISIVGVFLLIKSLVYLFSDSPKPPHIKTQQDYTALQQKIRNSLAEVNDTTWVLDSSKYSNIQKYFENNRDTIRDYFKETRNDSILSIFPSFDTSSTEKMYESLIDSLEVSYNAVLIRTSKEQQKIDKKEEKEKLRAAHKQGYNKLKSDIQKLLKSDKFSAELTDPLREKLEKEYSAESSAEILIEQLELYKKAYTIKYQIDKLVKDMTKRQEEIAKLEYGSSNEFKELENKIQAYKDNIDSIIKEMGLEKKYENEQYREIHRWGKELLKTTESINKHLLPG